MMSGLFALVLAAAAAPATTSIAVMDIAVRDGVSPQVAVALTEAVAGEVRKRRGRSKVISAEDIRTMLHTVAQHQKMGCETEKDVACMSEIGGALGADLLLTGSLARLGSTLIFSLKLVDVPRGAVMKGVSTDLVVKQEDDLLSAARDLVAQLFPQVELAPQVTIEATPEADLSALHRHRHLPAIAVGVAGLAAGGVAIFGLTQVLAYDNDVNQVNANQGAVNYQHLMSEQSAARVWQPLGIGLAVLGAAGLAGAVLLW